MNIVLIGFGYWGPNIARNAMESKGINLLGICDSKLERLEKAKILYGASVEYFTDYKDLLGRSDIDGFALAVKNDVGQEIAVEILNAKKHLFMEKPLAKSVKNAQELKRIAVKNDLILHVDHVMVFNPAIKIIKALVDSGEIGELTYFDSSRVNLGPSIKKDVNAMWDLAVHDLAVLDYISNGAKANHVNALGLNKYGIKEELTYLTIQYDGFIAMLKSSWISPLKERMMVIGGTKKMIVFNELSMDKLMIYDKGINVISNEKFEYGKYEMKIRMGEMYSPHIEHEDALLNSLNHFSECARTHKESITGADQAIRVLRILEMADEEIANKRGK